MKLIIITSPEQIEHELVTINELFATGLELLHLRKPGFTARQMEEILVGIERKYLTRVMLHSHHELIGKYGLRGCHLPAALRKDMDSSVLPERCSTSCHSIAEMKQLRSEFEYCFISPVFDSISKPGYQQGVDSSELARAITELQTQVVALGGIDGRTLPRVPRECWGAAILGAIWKEDELSKRLENFEQLQNISANL